MVKLLLFLSVNIFFVISILMNQQTLILIFVANKSGTVEIGLVVLAFFCIFQCFLVPFAFDFTRNDFFKRLAAFAL